MKFNFNNKKMSEIKDENIENIEEIVNTNEFEDIFNGITKARESYQKKFNDIF